MKVVHLGEVRDLLAQWDRVRDSVRGGKTRGFAIALQDEDGREVIYTGGTYKADPASAMKSTLRLSAALVDANDPAPQALSERRFK
jgi:hypothetical protein